MKPPPALTETLVFDLNDLLADTVDPVVLPDP
jgi:hypothetical protein